MVLPQEGVPGTGKCWDGAGSVKHPARRREEGRAPRSAESEAAPSRELGASSLIQGCRGTHTGPSRDGLAPSAKGHPCETAPRAGQTGMGREGWRLSSLLGGDPPWLVPHALHFVSIYAHGKCSPPGHTPLTTQGTHEPWRLPGPLFSLSVLSSGPQARGEASSSTRASNGWS